MKLSVVLIKSGTLESLQRCLERLEPQVRDKPYEIVVPVDIYFGNYDGLRARFPQVRFLTLEQTPSRSTPGSFLHRHDLFEYRVASALSAAKGEVVGLLQDTFLPDPDWCEKTLAGHRQLPHAVIGGAVEQIGKGVLGWSVYFLEFSRYMLPLQEGPVEYISDVNVSYKRRAIEQLRPLFRPRYNEAVAHWTLRGNGEVIWQYPPMVVRQDRGRLTVRQLVGERLSWGSVFGAARAHKISWPMRTVYVLASPLIPFLRVARVGRKVLGAGRNIGPFLVSLPTLFAMAVLWSAGEAFGCLTGRPAPHGDSN
ncbi:MAG: hypothetical protein ABI806_00510 [Candidatus Solibacter sp.]